MSRITAPVGEVTTPTMRGRYGSGSLRCGIEQALGGERALPLLEQSHEGADAGRLEIVDDDLIGRFVGIGGDPAFDYDLEPLLRLELEPLKGAPPDERVDDGVLVLELEVAVA